MHNYFFTLDRFIKLAILVLSIFTLFTFLARMLHLPFISYSYISLFLGISTYWIFRKKTAHNNHEKEEAHKKQKVSHLAFIGLLTLGFATGAFTSILNSPEEDDTMYVSPVVYSIENPHIALDSDMEWLAAWNNDEKITNFFMFFSHIYEYFLGTVSFLTGIDFLWLYQVFGSFFWGFAVPVVYFYLLVRFVTDKAALFGTFMIIATTLFVFRDIGGSYGMFWSKIWIGKTILQFIYIPIIASLTYDYVIRPSKANWIYIFAAVTSAIAFTTSSLFLIPVLMLVLMTASILKAIIIKDKIHLIKYTAIFFTLTAIIIFALLLHTKMSYVMNEEVNKITGFINQPSLFQSSYSGLFNDYFSLSSILIAISVLYLSIIQKKYSFIVLWFWFSIILFVNPIMDNLVAQYVTSHLAYPRIFHIVPWLPMIGLFFSDIYEVLSKYIKQIFGLIFVIFSLIALTLTSTFLLNRNAWDLSFAFPNYAYWLGIPTYVYPPNIKVDEQLANDVKEIIKVLPHGNTLSTMRYSLAIPMISSHYPQYYSNPYTSVKLLGRLSGNEEESDARLKGLYYLFGDQESRNFFEKLIQTNVKNLVIDAATNNQMDIEKIVLSHGFYIVSKTDRYVLYTQKNPNNGR